MGDVIRFHTFDEGLSFTTVSIDVCADDTTTPPRRVMLRLRHHAEQNAIWADLLPDEAREVARMLVAVADEIDPP